MHPHLDSSLFDSLERPRSALLLDVSRSLLRLRPGKCVLTVDAWQFDLDDYVEAGRCTATLLPGVPAHLRQYLDESQTRLVPQTIQAWRKVEWEGAEL